MSRTSEPPRPSPPPIGARKGELAVFLLVVAALAFAVHAARPPPTLGRAGPVLACAVPVERAGAGVVCLTTEQARASGARAGAHMSPERLAAWHAPVDVNRATVEELASLDGIGVKLAERIVAARPFARVEDIARVRGIGMRRLARLRARLVLDE